MALTNAIPDGVGNDYARLQGNLKSVYAGNKINNIVPDNVAWVFDAVPFVPAAERLGDQYVEAVNLQIENGFTLSSSNEKIVDLVDPSPGIVKRVLVDAGMMIGQAYLSFGMAAKAARANSAQAFEKATSRVIANLILGHRRRQAMSFLYGGTDIGVVASVTGNTIVITPATFAPGIFVGGEGLGIEVFSGDLATQRVNPTISGTQRAGKVVASNFSTHSITLDGVPASVAAGDRIFVAGTMQAGGVTQEGAGIASILDNRTTLFGIDTTQFPSFRGNTYDATAGASALGLPNAKLSQALLDDAAVSAFNRGYQGKLKLFVSGRQWQNLNSEMVARVRPDRYSTTETAGYRSLSYWTNAGEVETVASPWIKDGEGFLLHDDWKRVGTQDIALGDPLNQDQVMRRIEGKTGYSILSFSLQTVFCSTPMYSTHIVNLA